MNDSKELQTRQQLTGKATALYAKNEGKSMPNELSDVLEQATREAEAATPKPVTEGAERANHETTTVASDKRQEEAAQREKAIVENSWGDLKEDKDPEAQEKVAFLIKNGITRKEYEENKTKVFDAFLGDPEKRAQFERLVNDWRKVLNPGDYSQKKGTVWTLAASGISFKQYVQENKYNWAATFSTPLHEALKRKQLLSWFLEVLREVLAYTMKEVLGEEIGAKISGKVRNEMRGKDKAELQIEGQRAARVSWDLVNAHNKEVGNEPSAKDQADETYTQNEMVKAGLGPGDAEMQRLITEVRQTEVDKTKKLSDPDREDAIETVIRENLPPELDRKFTLTAEEKQKLMRIHMMGKGGVGQYTQAEISEKRRALEAFFEGKGIPGSLREQLARSLMEPGYLGGDPEGVGKGGDPGSGPNDVHGTPDASGPETDEVGGGSFTAESLPSEKQMIDSLEIAFNHALSEAMRAAGIKSTDKLLRDRAGRERVINEFAKRTPLNDAQRKALEQVIIEREADAKNPPEILKERSDQLNEDWARWEAEQDKLGRQLGDKAKSDIEHEKRWNRGPDVSPFAFRYKWEKITEEGEKAGIAADPAELSFDNAKKAQDAEDARNPKEAKNRKFSSVTMWEQLKQFEEGKGEHWARVGGYITSAPDPEERARRMQQAYSEYQENLFESQTPKNIEDVAWQIGMTDQEKWGTEGAFPILEIVKDAEGKEVQRVNKENFVRWVRERMMYLHNDSPDDPINFFQAIQVPKSYRPISLIEMLNHNGIYFKSAKEKKDPKKPNGENLVMMDLVDEVKREVWLFGESRKFDIEYRSIMGNEDGMAKKLQELYYGNTFTKTVWGKSSLYWILTQDQGFKGKERDAQGNEAEKHDHRLGAAINTAFLAYYNIDDPEMLKRYIGGESALFHADKLRKYRDKQAGIIDDVKKSRLSDAELRAQGMDDEQIKQKKLEWKRMADSVLSDEEIDKIYGDKDDGKIKNFEEYHDKLNLFNTAEFNARAASMVRAIITDDIIEKHNLYRIDKEGNRVVDADNAEYAETFAFSMQRWTGSAARNDWEANGYDAWTKLQRTRSYRRKQSRNKSGGAFGNPYTLHQLRQMGTNFVTGVKTESEITAEDMGKNFYTKTDGYSREGNGKRPLEVFEEIHAAGNSENELNKAAGQLVFPELTMRQYALNHVNRTMGVFQSVVEAQEIKLEKFTRVDPYKGVMFERDQFSKVVQEEFLKPLRYAYSTWGQLDFTMPVRIWDPEKADNIKDMTADSMQTVSLAQAMFGKEMLDIPEFWKKDDKNGSWVWIIKDGKRVREKRVRHLIDPSEIQNNKAQLWKQVAKTRIAAELYSHVDWHSNDTRYDFSYYETIIKALEQIPGGVTGDDTDMQSTKVIKDSLSRFFTEDDINWIRKKGGVSSRKLFWVAVFKALWEGSREGFGKGINMTFKHGFDFATK